MTPKWHPWSWNHGPSGKTQFEHLLLEVVVIITIIKSSPHQQMPGTKRCFNNFDGICALAKNSRQTLGRIWCQTAFGWCYHLDTTFCNPPNLLPDISRWLLQARCCLEGKIPHQDKMSVLPVMTCHDMQNAITTWSTHGKRLWMEILSLSNCCFFMFFAFPAKVELGSNGSKSEYIHM